MLLATKLTDYFYMPFAWILRSLYMLSNSYVFALVLFAIVFKLILLPAGISQQKGTAKQQRLQPKVRRIQAKYAGDQKKIQEETQALYQREGFNPIGGGCAPMLIQFPIIIGLYKVIYMPLQYVLKIPTNVLDKMKAIAETLEGAPKPNDRRIEMFLIDNFEAISSKISGVSADVMDQIRGFVTEFSLFGVPLGQTPAFSTVSNFGEATTSAKLLLLIPILSGLTSLLSSFITFRRQKVTNPEMAKNPTTGCMTFGMPLMSVYFGFLFPAGIGVYWIVQNILSTLQIAVLNRTHSNEKIIAKEMVIETIKRRSKENNTKFIANSK